MADFKPGDRVRLDLNGEKEFRKPLNHPSFRTGFVSASAVPELSDDGLIAEYVNLSDFWDFHLVYVNGFTLRVHESQLRKA